MYNRLNSTLGVKMIRVRKVWIFRIVAAILVFANVIFYTSGFFDHMREIDFEKFTYPLNEDISQFVEELKKGRKPSRGIINEYRYNYLTDPSWKCSNDLEVNVVFVIKSSVDHFERREVIRRTWGNEEQFPGREIRRFFIVGTRPNGDLLEKVREESGRYDDIIQADFLDTYNNNTIKTMMGFKWLLRNCPNSKFYMFLDDDYYVSIKNVLRYIENPGEYPKYNYTQTDIRRFYSGNCVPSRPMRDILNKNKLFIDEYPYNKFPLYSTAGAYILSADALEDLFYASFFTKHFRFDDVYLGILSRKMNIIPRHTRYISAKWDRYEDDFEKHCVASHGFEDTEKMLKLWTRQKLSGYA